MKQFFLEGESPILIVSILTSSSLIFVILFLRDFDAVMFSWNLGGIFWRKKKVLQALNKK